MIYIYINITPSDPLKYALVTDLNLSWPAKNHVNTC